jgi:predicted O-methyltransferase YrrM
MTSSIKNTIKKIPGVKELITFYTNLVAIRDNKLFEPPGHFYSPIPSIDEIKKDEVNIFGNVPVALEGIDLHEEEQRDLLKVLIPFYKELPHFEADHQAGMRYYYVNHAYSYSDAILLFCMMRFLKPKKIIEVGSGFSSILMLDTNELFFNNSIEMVIIDPYPNKLLSLVKESDLKRIKILRSRLQDVDLNEFETLQPNDLLFIDSTHVGKTNSDVNRILFNILPMLSPGVHVHFHDIFYPFEYPKQWVYEGRAWNEAYLLRAFLQYNRAFRIVLMNTFMEYFHESFFQENMPLCMKAKGGSIWIKRE